MFKKRLILIIAFILFVPLLVALCLPAAGQFLVVSDPLNNVDALVILAGDENERIAAGVELFQQNFANWFILTDMRLNKPNSQGIYAANVKRKAIEKGIPPERILIIPGQVSTTEEEVNNVKRFILAKGFHSLIVVTSPFHTRRVDILLHEAFRSNDITVIVHPARQYPYHAEVWWRTLKDRQLTALEYAKVTAHLLGCNNYESCGPFSWEWLVVCQKNLLRSN